MDAARLGKDVHTSLVSLRKSWEYGWLNYDVAEVRRREAEIYMKRFRKAS